MERGNYIAPFRCLKTSVKFKGETTNYVTNFSPSSAKPGDILYVDFPRIKEELIVPGTFALTFDLDVVLDPVEPGDDVKTYPVDNLAANIISEFRVKVGPQTIFELNYSYLYNTYKDLWLSETERKNLIYNGIVDMNDTITNLKIKKCRTDLNTKLPVSANITALKNIYGKRYRLPFNFEMITDHMPISGELLESKLTFEIKINDKKNVLNYTSETANFEMKQICLEFQTIKDMVLYREVERNLIGGSSFLFEHVHHYKREEILKNATFFNVEIQGLDRKSLKGILILFREDQGAGARESEHFIYPGITNVKYTIDGIPNKHYSSGLQKWNSWDEASKHFFSEDAKNGQNSNMDMLNYYARNKFALWTDLRSTQDNNLHGSGKAHEAKNVIKMEITKENNGEGKYIMHIYVVSDARVIIEDKLLKSFDY